MDVKHYLYLLFQKYNGWLRPIVFLGLLCGALVGFIEVVEEVGEGETKVIDEKILLLLRDSSDLSDPLGPRFIEEAARDITALGSYIVVSLAILFTCGLLLLLKRKIEALFCFLSVMSGAGVIHILKIGFDRPRPDTVSHLVDTTTASFPSGHSTIAFVTFLSLGFLASKSLNSNRIRAYVIALSVAIASLIGMSRVYLGVHYPSDVLAGMCLGVFWALLWLGIELELDRRYFSRPNF
ncbi:MAG: phosphatase PAP2 family protein [Bacteriovoracaceae bacterium]|nr:phosphatase PAP2 family protein [Bacteriovoracaceae bacterium]